MRNATAGTFDVSTDAWPAYTPEIDLQLSHRANHSIVVKVYDKPEETRERYSPGNFVTVEKSVGSGNPDLERACTSHVERKNGSLRQWCRRLTRRLRVTPAMEAGLVDHQWTLQELMAQ